MKLKNIWAVFLIFVAVSAEGEITVQNAYPVIKSSDCIFVGNIVVNDKIWPDWPCKISVIHSLKGDLKDGDVIKLDMRHLADFQPGVLGIIFLIKEQDGAYASTTPLGSFLPIILPPNYDWSKEVPPETTILNLLNYYLENASQDQVIDFLKLAEITDVPIPDYFKTFANSSNEGIRASALHTLARHSQLASADKVIDAIMKFKNSLRFETYLYGALVYTPPPTDTKVIFPLAARTTDPHEMMLLMQALRKWAIPQTVPVLLQGLDSTDIDAQYNAVMGLQAIFQPKDVSLGPSRALFVANSANLIEEWKKYVKEHYP